MTVNERIADIKSRTGLSEQTIRTVLNAETESVMHSLERGEKAVLIGRCAFTPQITYRTGIDGERVPHIRVSAKASAKITDYLFTKEDYLENDFESIEGAMEKYDNSIRVFQIDELA